MHTYQKQLSFLYFFEDILESKKVTQKIRDEAKKGVEKRNKLINDGFNIFNKEKELKIDFWMIFLI